MKTCNLDIDENRKVQEVKLQYLKTNFYLSLVPSGMAIFLKNVTFHGILLDSLFDGSTEERARLNKLVIDGLESGVVTPLPHTLFTRDSAEDAFR